MTTNINKPLAALAEWTLSNHLKTDHSGRSVNRINLNNHISYSEYDMRKERMYSVTYRVQDVPWEILLKVMGDRQEALNASCTSKLIELEMRGDRYPCCPRCGRVPLGGSHECKLEPPKAYRPLDSCGAWH